MLKYSHILLTILSISLLTSSTKAALCVTSSSAAGECERCYAGIIDAAKACVDATTPVADCGIYNDNEECQTCLPTFVKIVEADSTETAGTCLATTIQNCIHGVKRLDGEFCHVCALGFLPAMGNTACVAVDKTIRQGVQDCEWNKRHGECGRCVAGFGFHHTRYFEKTIEEDGSVIIHELDEHEYHSGGHGHGYGHGHGHGQGHGHDDDCDDDESEEDDDDESGDHHNSSCSAFPDNNGYDWTGCLAYTVNEMTIHTYAGTKTIKRFWREYTVPYYTTTTEEVIYCSLCDGASGYYQDAEGGSCIAEVTTQ